MIEVTTDPREALASCAPFLENDPVSTTVVGSVLNARATSPSVDDNGNPTGRYWLATANGSVVGIGMRSPIDFMFSLATDSTDVARAFARHLNETEHDLHAASGEARTSAAFAGEWASLRGCAAGVSAAQQLYELHELTTPGTTTGQALSVRLAADEDVEALCEWFVGFDEETFNHGIDPEPIVRSKLGWLWMLSDHDVPCAMAAATPAASGVRRVQAVYTPLDQRGKGYGAAITAAVSQAVIDGDDRAVLFTDLANPTSNRIYRRLGYRSCGEFMNWSFGDATMR